METRDEEVEVIQTAEEELEVPTVAETTEQQQPIGGEIGGDEIKVSKDQIMRMMTEINQLKEMQYKKEQVSVRNHSNNNGASVNWFLAL